MRAQQPPANRVRPILVLEMSEIPWRLIDRFRDDYPNIDRFFGGSQTYTTMAVDKGELSPWVTWPSFHRGMSHTQHGIEFLGQDPASFKGTPIWEHFRDLGHSIGICGSLQSWPPINPGPGGFFIPDTFARDERCIPHFVEPLQKLNLSQAVDGAELPDGVLPLLGSVPRLGIRPTTLARVARQLVDERFDKVKVARRPILQTMLMWDVFKKLYRPAAPPAFSTFFSSHVAGVMHRAPDNATMRFALKCTDNLLADAFGFLARDTDLILVWASSMGQDTRHNGVESGTLVVSDCAALLRCCGLTPADFKVQLAVAPHAAVEIADGEKRRRARAILTDARTTLGRRLFRVEEKGSGLSVTTATVQRADFEAGPLVMNGRVVDWKAAGLRAPKLEPGTAHHIPEGTMAVYGSGFSARDDRRVISARDCKDFLLELSGLAVPKSRLKAAG